MKTLIAGAIGAAAMGVVSAVAYAATQRSDPGMTTLGRNSAIAAALAIGVGIWVAKKKNPLYGAAIATGGAALIISTKIAGLVGSVIARPTSPAMAAVFGNMGAYSRQMGGYQRMSGYQRAMRAVFGDMGAVYGNIGARSRPQLPPAARRPQNGFNPAIAFGANPFG